jgi:signal transduction histidine kinase
MLAALNAFFLIVFKQFDDRGMVETNLPLVKNVIRASIIITATLFMVVIVFIRHALWNRPIKIFSEAAKKIAKGDFTVRIPPLRKDGKKDFIEVMFDDFNTMAEELASTETMKNDFIANVSHEIKTPLSVIQSYAYALQKDTLPLAEYREYTQSIIEAAQKLTMLVTNILKLSKLENQEIVLKTKPYNLSEQLRQCAAVFEELWEQKNIDFEADLDEVNVSYDESMLEIVWNNLFSNAVKFTNPGGKIIVSLKVQNTMHSESLAVISITDTGIGINKETQKHIFDKFFQGDTSHTQEGNGLGLALVKKTIDLLGGSVFVDSESGNGTSFTVCLKI